MNTLFKLGVATFNVNHMVLHLLYTKKETSILWTSDKVGRVKCTTLKTATRQGLPTLPTLFFDKKHGFAFLSREFLGKQDYPNGGEGEVFNNFNKIIFIYLSVLIYHINWFQRNVHIYNIFIFYKNIKVLDNQIVWEFIKK